MKKLIKRGFAALLALTLALGMSVSAFAADGTQVAKKDYRLTNPGTTSPAETFKFTVTKVGVTDATKTDGTPLTTDDMPELTITDVTYAAGEAGSANRVKDLVVTPKTDFPTVGVYTYEVTETAGNTAGVDYNTVGNTNGKDEGKLTLTATVYHDDKTKEMKVTYAFRVDENKGADIVNTYSAGSLYVGKTLTGNLGNKTQKFNIKVSFTAPEGKTVKSDITYGDKTITPADFADSSTGTVHVDISLADGETVEFKNVPYGVTYDVTEYEYKDYKTTYGEDKSGTIDSRMTVAHIFNEKEGTVDTGVILHSAPYILLLVGVGAAAVAFLILRKHREV